MRIKAIEPIAVSLPMKKPVKMAGETVTRADNILVRIETDDGAVGWGEAASAPTMTGETVASMMAAVLHMAPGLLKRPADDFAGAAAAMDAQMYGNSGAKAAIEIALHDLVGRAKGLPLHALFGGKRRDRIPLLAVIGSDDAAADLREAQERRNAGYVIYKIKVGVDAPEADAARTRDICRVLGKDCLISADANQGWSAEEGVRYVRAVADTALGFFEQPVPRPRSRRHGARRRGEPRADRRRRGHSFAGRYRTPSRRQGSAWREPEGDQARRHASGIRGKPAVRPARHEPQHLLQDRRIRASPRPRPCTSPRSCRHWPGA